MKPPEEEPHLPEPSFWEVTGRITRHTLTLLFLFGCHMLLSYASHQPGHPAPWWFYVGEVALAVSAVADLIAAATSETAIGCIHAARRVAREWRRRQ